MTFWIEMRCENRNEPSANSRSRSSRERCWSHDDNGPAMMAWDTHADVIDVVRELRAEAKGAGWVKVKDGWICPYCAKQLAVS